MPNSVVWCNFVAILLAWTDTRFPPIPLIIGWNTSNPSYFPTAESSTNPPILQYSGESSALVVKLFPQAPEDLCQFLKEQICGQIQFSSTAFHRKVPEFFMKVLIETLLHKFSTAHSIHLELTLAKFSVGYLLRRQKSRHLVRMFTVRISLCPFFRGSKYNFYMIINCFWVCKFPEFDVGKIFKYIIIYFVCNSHWKSTNKKKNIWEALQCLN